MKWIKRELLGLCRQGGTDGLLPPHRMETNSLALLAVMKQKIAYRTAYSGNLSAGDFRETFAPGFSMLMRLSLALKKDVCDWLRQTLNPSELKVSDQSEPELIHTSCRSESSNISLVVLDNPYNSSKWPDIQSTWQKVRFLYYLQGVHSTFSHAKNQSGIKLAVFFPEIVQLKATRSKF